MSSLDELKLRIKETPISAIIGQYLAITTKGHSKLALCPFHSDSKPSLHINDNRNMFMCFVDNIGGDAINFVMRYKNLEFIDALKDICNVMGWNYDDYVQDRKQSPHVEMAKRILSKVAQVYRKFATESTLPVYADFIKNRGLNEEIASTYTLGFAPANNAISNYLGSIPDEKERAYALKIAEQIGIIRADKYKAGSHYDTFRERIVFPIWDQFGQVIGFTTRATKEEQKAKYMNSIDSFIFNKKNLLYGLHLAKNYIRSHDSVLVVEGNMDQIALYQHGFHHSVAIQGVALGDNSLSKLKAMTKNLILALDNDDAGFKAMERINKQCLEEAIVPRYVNFEPHKDADEFLQAEGALALKERIEKAPVFLDILLDKTLPDIIPELPDRQLELLRKCFEVVAPLGEELSATERLIRMAQRLGLKSDSSQIIKNYQDYLKTLKAPKKFTPAPEPKPVIPEPEELAYVEEENPNYYEELEGSPEFIPEEVPLTKGEKGLVLEILQNPECLTHEVISELLDLVSNDGVKKYISKLKGVYLEILDSEFIGFATNLLDEENYPLELRETAGAALYRFSEHQIPQDDKTTERLLQDLKRKLQEDQLKTERNKLKNQLNSCNTQEEFNSLSAKILEKERQLRDIKNLKSSKV